MCIFLQLKDETQTIFVEGYEHKRKSASNPHFFIQPGGFTGCLSHYSSLVLMGFYWVLPCLTGLTKILLLCVQSQNQAPGDV